MSLSIVHLLISTKISRKKNLCLKKEIFNEQGTILNQSHMRLAESTLTLFSKVINEHHLFFNFV
jgi:hypothetical protein